MEKWIILGNLGGDPEMRYTGNGVPVTNISVAVSRKWVDKGSGQQREHTTWYRATGWNRTAEIMGQYLKKGRQVYLECEPVTDDRGNPKIWVDPQGQARASFECTVQRMELIGGANAATTSDSGQTDDGPPQAPYTSNDEIPF